MGPGGRTGAGAGVGAGAGARVQQSTAVAPLRKPQFKRLSAVDHAAGVHERNRYKNAKPDFAALAIKYPDFAKFVTLRPNGKGLVDFKDPHAARALTKVLLKEDFGIEWGIPLDRLCPALTNRLNYIHWVEDLLAMSAQPPPTTVRGIDIGTGASCIYALLGATMNKWQWIATEVDAESFRIAKENVQRNGLGHLIDVRHVPVGSFLVGNIKPEDGPIEFCVCNPPFFSTLEEAVSNPANASMGQCTELVYPGGDLAFVRGIMESSKHLATQVRWFSSMIGKKSALKDLVRAAGSAGATAIRTTQLLQGKTIRWCIAWTFFPLATFKPGVADQVNKAFAGGRKSSGEASVTFQVRGITAEEARKRVVEAFLAMGFVRLDSGQSVETVGVAWEELNGTWQETRKGVAVGSPVSFSLSALPFETGSQVQVRQVGSCDKVAFQRFADVIRRDTERTSRKWRRLQKRREEGARPGKKQRQG